MSSGVTILGASGPSLAVLVTLGLFALGGALARLFWDAATADYSLRRQIGFVGISVVAAFALTFVAWERGRDYPAFMVGLATISALIGPADVLTLLQALFMRVVGGSLGGGTK